MSGFGLVPVDGAGGGGDPIHLPPGETVLGRGPLLGVSDKRVSRLHGLLENLDGKLRLKPTHVNPCFVQSTLSDDPRPLQRDAWHRLHPGDLISLLPGLFIYRVESLEGGDHTPRNSQMFEEEKEGEEEELPVSPEPPPPPPLLPPPPQQEVATRSPNKEDVTPSTARKRVLPAWMLAVPSSTSSTSSSSFSSSSTKAVKRSKQTPKKATPPKTGSPEGAELSKEEMPRKRRRRKLSDEEEEVETDVPQPALRPQVEHQEEEEEEEEGRGGRSPAEGMKEVDESEDRKSKNGQPETSSRRRTPCPYGKSCYRKNPVHFQESSHPGDSDYEEEEEEEEEEEDRPECPYGTDCYRKNPLHRKEFKHTKRPARATRAAPKKQPANDDEEDEYDDSFIDDDSDDGGGDSDYEPPVSDDSGKEDVERLQQEARAFTRKRK